jgi:photosystem II stability/assembly factor-like uncharacterized protein
MLYSSTAGGDPGTWAYVGGVGDSASLRFTLDPGANPVALYAGGFYRGAWKSTNGGRNWQEYNNGIQMLETLADIDLDPQNPERIFVGGETGWRTTDGGQSWSYVIDAYPAFAIHSTDSNIVLVGVSSGSERTILRSSDGGLTFTPVFTPTFLQPGGPGGSQAILDIEYAPSDGNIVYAGGKQDPGWQGQQAVVLRSATAGLYWTEVLTRPADSFVGALAVDPTTPDVLYAGIESCQDGFCQESIYRTKDGGASWQETLTATTGFFRAIAVDPQKPWVVYAGTDWSYMYKSTDGGDTWVLVRTCCPLGWFPTLDAHVPSYIYIVGNASFVGESRDGGLTWSGADTPLCQGAPRQNPGDLAVDDDTLTQTLYGGFAGLWVYQRAAPQPGEPVTGTVSPSAPSAPVGETVQVGGLVVDGHENWVANGTVVTFTTSPEGTFEDGAVQAAAASQDSQVVTRTTLDGQVWATLRGVQYGTAIVTMTVDGVYGMTEVQFTAPYAIYLPLVVRSD